MKKRSTSSVSLFSLALSLPHSARLSRLDPPELPQPGRPVRPETAAAGGRARGGTARGTGGVSAGRGAETGVRAAQGGDEDAAKQPEGQGQCRVLIIPPNAARQAEFP